jgi:hypothetical protein
MLKVTPRTHYDGGRDPVPLVQEAGWAPGPGWTGAENLAPPGFDPRTVQPVASRILKKKRTTMKMMMILMMIIVIIIIVQ